MPNVGDIKHGNEVGFASDALVIYFRCKCGAEYFTQYDKQNNRARVSICANCHRENQKQTWMKVQHFTDKVSVQIRPF